MWKSNNQGVKEETFIQTSRRGGDRQPRWRGCMARQQLVDWAVPYWHVDKMGGATGEQDRLHNPGFQRRQNKASGPLTVKTCGGFSGGRNSQFLKVGQEPSKQHCSLSDTSPTYSTTMQRSGQLCPGEYQTLYPLQCNRCTKTKKYDPNERPDQNSRKKTK